VRELLVVAGEASGDRAAAGVIAALRDVMPEGSVHAFGLGGAALSAERVELVRDLRDSAALGFGEVVRKAYAVGGAYARVVHEAKRRRVESALLVNYTEFNMRLAAHLHARGVRVLWYGAPQIWAWRPGRASKLRPFVDRMAVMLPFEEALWRSHGVDAHYVGHPAREVPPIPRDVARASLGLTDRAKTVAILPGSRPHEVKSLLMPMLQAYERVRDERASMDARVLLTPSLDDDTRTYAMAMARAMRVDVVQVPPRTGASSMLGAFDVAMCASGTVALEAALARAVPIITYRVGLVSEVVARHFLQTADVALPNILLGRRAFAELLQRDARAPQLAEALAHALDHRSELVASCNEVEAKFGAEKTPSRAIARMLRPWLSPVPEHRDTRCSASP
jgi:lipid-A-disaccharide synthase